MPPFDALLVISFGGPEKREDVLPFLENVLRGKNVPRERMLEIAEHYYHFGGRSPINDQNRALIATLEQDFAAHELKLPIYWGNRNWHPLIGDTIRQMHQEGIRNAVALATSAFGSYSGCRQYRRDIATALEAASAPEMTVEKLNNFHDLPEFIEVMAERVRAAMQQLPDPEQLIFTAHSIPVSMAESSPYVRQLELASEKVAAACGMRHWALVYQSRSGPPSQPWLEPDICDYLRTQHAAGARQVILCPIGFISDHMEVIYDLDTEARALCDEIGLQMVRAGTAGAHPLIASMVRRMILEHSTTPVMAHCEPGCCPTPQRPAVRPVTSAG
ncbi:MAG TPA: ferrochelatase [Candidatus Angelobacter sp.]|jgi:ferrochelatase|nr:ferrochelatase [Candidatus Angelobacter sp.]